MKRLATQLSAFAVAVSLAALPLAGCGSNSASTASGDATSTASQATTDTVAPIDTASWATLRDALAIANPDNISYSYDDKYFVCVFKSGNNYVRTVSQMDASKQQAFADLDISAKDYLEKLIGVVGDFPLVSAQDVTAEQLSQTDLDALVGKTGQELLDAGFVFESYFMYGGEQTGAEMGKGCFSYSITFDTHTDESQTEDGGASIKGAKVTEANGFGNVSNTALSPENAESQI